VKKPHRCNNCRSRFTLRRHHAEYQREQRCPHCGSKRIYFCTHTYRERVERRKHVCYCCGPGDYPHRAASSPWCTQHPTGPELMDYVARYG
jgi:DNA-directed RNA polymerase subunit RPC12/RpoP